MTSYALCRQSVEDKHGASGGQSLGLDRGGYVVEIKMRGRHDGSGECGEA
jgi:hypothetical protein